MVYRCDAQTSFSNSATSCGTSGFVSSFVRIQLQDTYTPQWTRFGVGQPITYNVVRYVMIGQAEAH